jgi:hypothetical protein
VNAEQATVVRQIFALSAEGHGFTRIAKALNEDQVAPPRRASRWAPTAVREILLRPLYRGEIVWNKQRKRDRWGVKKYLARPEREWLRLDAPELRIVAEDLWEAAHRRMEATRALYAAGGSYPDRPDREKYLLSGIATCATCGGSLVAFTRDYKRAGQRGRFYGFSFNHKRGAKVCTNRLLIRQDKLDQVVLEPVAEALDERILERAVEKAASRISRHRRALPDRRAQLERELADVEARIQRGLDALLAGVDAADELRVRLKAENARKTGLAAELEALKGSARRPSSTTGGSVWTSAPECGTFAACWAGTSRGPGRSFGSSWWDGWNARPSTTVGGSAIASRRETHTRSCSLPRSPHHKW